MDVHYIVDQQLVKNLTLTTPLTWAGADILLTMTLDCANICMVCW